MRPGKQRGFTLIELMITVAIVAILAAVAYPAYTSALVKNRRAAAQSYLSDVAQRQQQYLMDSRSYTTSTLALKITEPADVTRYYTVLIEAPTPSVPPAFTVTATPTAAGSQVKDGPLSITQNGTKLPPGKW